MEDPFMDPSQTFLGKKDCVLEKRSVFRSNKKFYQKDLFLDNKIIKKIIYNKFPLEQNQKVIEMIRDFKICSSRSNPVSERNRRNAKKYVWLVGDPCYNFSREANYKGVK